MNSTECTLVVEADTLSNYFNLTDKDTSQPLIQTYDCPGTLFPSAFTVCCPENFQPLCCPQERVQIDDESFALVWIPIVVTFVCILAAMIVVICCFWSKCPLYTTCKSRHFTEESVAYQTDEEEEALNGAVEEKKGIKSYTLDDVKVKPIADV